MCDLVWGGRRRGGRDKAGLVEPSSGSSAADMKCHASTISPGIPTLHTNMKHFTFKTTADPPFESQFCKA